MISLLIEAFNISPKINEKVFFQYLEDEGGEEAEYITVKNDFDFDNNNNDIFRSDITKFKGKFTLRNVLGI